MTNEAVLKQWQEDPMDFIVNDNVAIEKGTIMSLSGNRIAIASHAATDEKYQAPAGIARREKIINSGRSRVALFRKGFFDMVSCSDFAGPLHWGAAVMISGVNTFCGIGSHETSIEAAIQSGLRLGHVLEDTTAAGQTVEVAVNI